MKDTVGTRYNGSQHNERTHYTGLEGVDPNFTS